MGVLFNFCTPVVFPVKNYRSLKKWVRLIKKYIYCVQAHTHTTDGHTNSPMCLQRQLEGDTPDQHPSIHIHNNPYIMLLSLKNKLHTLVSMRPTSHESQTEV